MDSMLKDSDLVNNPTARVPVCLCLDISGSMSGVPIKELEQGVKAFFGELRDDDVAKYSAEVCVVTFGGPNDWEVVLDFAGLENQPPLPRLTASGYTPMGEAVNLALDCLERRKQEYKDKGVDYFQPWLVLMTDGGPNGDEKEFNRAVKRTVAAVNSKRLAVFPIGIGDDADMNELAKFSPTRTPLRLEGLRFKEFFQWLSQSVSRTSMSMPGEDVDLDLGSIKGWAKL